MPGSISGLELIDELHSRRPSLPIIPVTGSDEEANLREALDRGAAGFITKPFKAAEIREKVAGVLSRVSLLESELRERLLAPTVASVLANAIEVRDASMEGHTERLASLALAIGHRLGLSHTELEVLELGAVLHDVGKIGIPDQILMKPGPLTAAERTIIETHPVVGDQMLAPLHMLETVRPVVRHHHERWDGAGYLDHLEGEEIPLIARILAVGDAFSAMTTTRPYRKALDVREALNRLEDAAGSQLEERLVRAFVDGIETAADAPLPGAEVGGSLWTPRVA
jgi:putative two-component system response regulator